MRQTTTFIRIYTKALSILGNVEKRRCGEYCGDVLYNVRHFLHGMEKYQYL